MSAENEVRTASKLFYAALNGMTKGDASAMADVWSRKPNISAQHPIGQRDEGREAVMDSFNKVAEIATGGEVRLVDQIIDAGSDMAVEIAKEVGTLTVAGEEVQINQRVTNVYRKEGGTWKVAHHHADFSPAMQAVLDRLATEAAAE